ncbi:carboxylic ester hydrolase isoform X2 [Leptinotarsa decemlineata]|uniref:carboxylic ester hydrolase isoform X2 n=1 Tax=Leptinotarsa decemlineata TaxID=7539 RepID=UPI003D305449
MISKNLSGLILWSIIVGETVAVSFVSKNEYNSTLQVATKSGIIQGTQVHLEHGKSYLAYYGIPYAAPPLNSLRFRDPHPVKRWKGVLNATTKLQSGCVETQFRIIGEIFQSRGTEDCLYANVYTPIRSNKSNYPVIFYIYGGAFIEGSAESYNPEYLVEHDLIIVNFNYRGGLFGFLSTEDEGSYGNYGLKDQFAALKWVNLNIKSFGGDPKRVTMAGHSSGSVSALYQMIYPKSWGLYCGVIGLSGEMSGALGMQKDSRKIAFDIGSYLGIKTNNSTKLVESLRKLELSKLHEAQNKVILSIFPNLLQTGLVFSPVIEKDHEDAFLTKNSMDLLKSGLFARVPLLTGMTSNEIAVLGQTIPLLRFLFLLYEWSPTIFPNQMNITSESGKRKFAREVKKKYFKNNSFVNVTSDEIAQLLSDLMYTRPITNSAKIMSSFIPVYFYVFEYRTLHTKEFLRNGGYPLDISLQGVAHIEDVIYIWKFSGLELTPEADETRKRMTKIWSNFARYGNPTPTVDPLLQNIIWPQIPKTKDIPYLRIDVNFSIEKNFRLEYVNFLNELAENSE